MSEEEKKVGSEEAVVEEPSTIDENGKQPDLCKASAMLGKAALWSFGTILQSFALKPKETLEILAESMDEIDEDCDEDDEE